MTYRDALFEGANVIVLGGTSGIGAATALAFAALGALLMASLLASQPALAQMAMMRRVTHACGYWSST